MLMNDLEKLLTVYDDDSAEVVEIKLDAYNLIKTICEAALSKIEDISK